MLEMAEEILATLIDDQISLGVFPLRSAVDCETVLRRFRPELIAKPNDDIFKTKQGFAAPEFIFKTEILVIVIIYIEKTFPNSVQTRESVVRKTHDKKSRTT